jgi:hypothetical protein
MSKRETTKTEREYVEACIELSQHMERANSLRRRLTVGGFDDLHGGVQPLLKRITLNCSIPASSLVTIVSVDDVLPPKSETAGDV